MSIPYKVVLFLEQDTIDIIDALGRTIGKKKDTSPTRSAAVAYLVRQHWKKAMINQADAALDKPHIVV
jgi:hypothetical protein